MLPLRQQHIQISRWGVDGVVKLGLIRFLGALDLAVQVWRGWFIRTEFDPILLQALLNDDGKKLTATIRLYALNGERHFFNNIINEIQSIVAVRRAYTRKTR